MNVFISWSGNLSKRVGELLYELLPVAIQRVKPYISLHDINPGERWLSNLSEALESHFYGIVCLTPNNLTDDERDIIQEMRDSDSFTPEPMDQDDEQSFFDRVKDVFT